MAKSCSPTNARTSGPPCTSSRAATSISLTSRVFADTTRQGHRSQLAPPAEGHPSQNARPGTPKVSSARSLPLLTTTARAQKSLFTRLSHPGKPPSEENTIASPVACRKIGAGLSRRGGAGGLDAHDGGGVGRVPPRHRARPGRRPSRPGHGVLRLPGRDPAGLGWLRGFFARPSRGGDVGELRGAVSGRP